MPEAQKFDLPVSGYEILEKILHAYALAGDKPVALEDIAARAGMGKTQVSPNHHFLVSLALVTVGKKKKLTPLGQQLALAISNKVKSDVSAVWNQAVNQCPSTRQVLEMIRVQGAIRKSDAVGKILQSLRVAGSKKTKTGANCLIDVFLKANLITEDNDNYVYLPAEARGTESTEEAKDEITTPEKILPNEELPPSEEILSNKGQPSVHIDVQIHIAADAKAEQIDQVFASMAKHLYGK